MTSAVPREFAVRRGRAARLQLPPRPNAAGSKLRRGGARSLANDVRQKAPEPGALYRLGEVALVAGANRRNARRHDLAALGDVPRQQANVLVVDLWRIRARKRT